MSSGQNENKRVMVIGLDGATYDLIDPWVKEGKLRNIARFMNRGSFGELTSTMPPLSPVAWTTSTTGANPGRHGIFDFLGRQPDTYGMKIFNSTMRRSKPVWELLSEAGKKVGVMNIPMTFPPDRVNGVMISGLGTPGPESSFTYPESLKETLKKEVGDYYIGLKHVPARDPDDEAESIQRLLTLVDNRYEAATYLMDNNPWDFFMMVFMETDTVQHMFWKYIDPRHPLYTAEGAAEFGDAIFRIYEKIDGMIGTWLDKYGENTTFIIMSDHGAGPIYKPFFIQKWLVDNGYLSISKTDRATSGEKSLRRRLKEAGSGIKKFLPVALKKRLRKNMPELRQKILAAQVTKDIQWEATRAFSEGAGGGIYVNLEGREPAGTVKPGAEYDELLEEISQGLLALRDPSDGSRVVAAVHRSDRIYKGEWVDHAPDLCIDWGEGYHGITGWVELFHDISRDGEDGYFGVLKPGQWTGSHRNNGIVKLLGEECAAGRKLEGCQIADITPTVLHLLGVEIPAAIDGRVIESAFTEEYLARHPVRYSDSVDLNAADSDADLTDDDSEKVQEQLRDLGYIE